MNETAKTKNPSYNVRANVLINLIRTLTMTILSFITFPYVTRALGDSVFGTYTWANTFVYYFLILARISIPNIAIRECAKVKDNQELLNKTVQEFFLMQAVMTLLSFGLMSATIFTSNALRDNAQLIFLLSINFLTGVFSFEWVYIALERHFYITVRSILLIAFSGLLTFTFVRGSATPSNYLYTYAFIAILGTVLTVIINLLYLPRFISLRKTQKYEFKKHFKSLFVLFLISFALALYNQTDEFILGFIDSSKASVGAYSVGVKGIDIVITLITSLYAVFMPRASYYYSLENKRFFQNLINYSLNITFFIAIPAIACMATMSKEITHLISGSNEVSYENAFLVLTILASMMLTYSIADNIYTEILIPMKKEKIYLFTMGIGVALNIGLSLLLALIPFRNDPVIGVAIATAGTDALILLFLFWKTPRYSTKAVFRLNNLKILIAGGAVAVFSFFMMPVFESLMPMQELWQSYLLSMIIVVAIDALIYIGGCLLLRENLVTSFLPSHRNKENLDAE